MDQPAITPCQARMARAGLALGLREASVLCGVSFNTLHKLELGKHVRPSPHILRTIREGYERAGVEFSAHGVASVRQV